MKTSLDNLFTLQARLMLALGVDVEDAQRPGIGDMSREAATGMVLESAEVLEAITKMHRAWKPDDNVDAKVEHAKEEAVDVLFYLTEMFISLGVNNGPALMELVHRKRAIVLARVVSKLYENPHAIADPQFQMALAQLSLYLPRVTSEIGDFLADPRGYTLKNIDIKNFSSQEEGRWTLPF